MIKKKRVLKIGNRIISEFNKPLIIPELGINHNGSIETAFKIVDAAKRSGAEIVKHQNLKLLHKFEWYIHKSLTRNILVLERN